MTLVDAYLTAAVLISVGLNSVLGWWWADPLSGLVIVYYGSREAHEAWQHASALFKMLCPCRRPAPPPLAHNSVSWKVVRLLVVSSFP